MDAKKLVLVVILLTIFSTSIFAGSMSVTAHPGQRIDNTSTTFTVSTNYFFLTLTHYSSIMASPGNAFTQTRLDYDIILPETAVGYNESSVTEDLPPGTYGIYLEAWLYYPADGVVQAGSSWNIQIHK